MVSDLLLLGLRSEENQTPRTCFGFTCTYGPVSARCWGKGILPSEKNKTKIWTLFICKKTSEQNWQWTGLSCQANIIIPHSQHRVIQLTTTGPLI